MQLILKFRKILSSTLILVLILGITSFLAVKMLPKPSQQAAASFYQKISAQPEPNQNLINQDQDLKIVPGEYIVKFKTNYTPENIANLLDAQGQKIKIKTKLDDQTFLMENSEQNYKNNSQNEINQAKTQAYTDVKTQVSDTFETIKTLQDQAQIVAVEPNQIIKIDFRPDDTFFGSQWHLQNTGQNGGQPGADIKAEAAWDMTQGSGTVVVAVIDTGIDLNHPDLADKILKNGSNQVVGYNFTSNNSDPSDTQGHGTHIAGIIAGKTNNGSGVAGVCPNCKIMPIKFIDGAGNGTAAAAISSINFAITNGAKVLNLSWTASTYSGSLQSAINRAYAAGITVVASAGNENISDYQFPADMNHVISVAATDRFDKKAFYSNFNDRITVSAPGSGILSTFPAGVSQSSSCGDSSFGSPNDGYGYCSGTSMATPVVAGIVGLVASLRPDFSPDQIAGQIIGTADTIDSLNPEFKGLLGTGRVNAYRAVTESPKPMLLYQNLQLSDPAGNNNFLGDPAENINLDIAIENRWAAANNVVGVLTTADPDIVAIQNTTSFGNINFGALASSQFKIKLGAAAILPKSVSFSLKLSSNGVADQIVNFDYIFRVADKLPLNFTFDDSKEGWNSDQIWHLSNLCATGQTAASSAINPKYWHFGKSNCGDYDFGLNLTGKLYSPALNKLEPGQSAALNFDQFLETENKPNFFDKATVKIKTYGQSDSSAITLLAAQNNSLTWKNTSVALPDSITRAGLFQIFFSFETGGGGNNTFKGWFVDNLKLELVNSAQANQLTAADVPNLDLSCDPSDFKMLTSCRFPLPAGKSLPTGLKIQIQNSPNQANCVLSTPTNLVECGGVATPDSVGFLPIVLFLDGNLVATDKTVKITGQNFGKARLVFSPNQGLEAPNFKSDTPINVQITDYQDIFSKAATAQSYVCSFEFGSIGSRSQASPNWISFGQNIPYDPVTGCQSQLTKAKRGNALNLDLRLKICPVSDPNRSCAVLYENYIYRFEGVGIASGG